MAMISFLIVVAAMGWVRWKLKSWWAFWRMLTYRHPVFDNWYVTFVWVYILWGVAHLIYWLSQHL